MHDSEPLGQAYRVPAEAKYWWDTCEVKGVKTFALLLHTPMLQPAWRNAGTTNRRTDKSVLDGVALVGVSPAIHEIFLARRRQPAVDVY